MGSFSIWHWMIVAALLLLMFGNGKISSLMGDMAQGIKAFKKGMRDDDHVEPVPSPKALESHATPKEKLKEKEPVA